MPAAAAKPIRLTKLVKDNDFLMVGSCQFEVADIKAIYWSAEWKCVVVKIACHAAVIATDVTSKADWDAWIASF